MKVKIQKLFIVLFLLGFSSACSRPNSAATSSATATSSAATHQAKKAVTPGPKHSPQKAVTKNSLSTTQLKQATTSSFGAIKGDNAVFVAAQNDDRPYIWHNQSQRADSVIKIFIMLTAFQQASENKWDWQEVYTLQKSDQVGGTGILQSQAPGTQLTNLELVTDMMKYSDNTATNIVINQLGGLPVVNQEIKALGLHQTKLARKMLDNNALQAGRDNMTSVADLGNTLVKLANHQLISPAADEQMLSIMQQCQNHTKLPQLLPTNVTIYNKTGEFDTYGVENDAAIIATHHNWLVIVGMSQNGQLNQQMPAFNQLGKQVYEIWANN